MIDKNREHYTARYAHIRLEDIVEKARDLTFLWEAIRKHTSWHGLYVNGFASTLCGKSVLELGSGDGLNALFMARLGAKVTAIDIAEPGIRILQQASDQLGLEVHTLVGDFLEFRLPKFDFIVGKAFLHHLEHDTEDDFIRKCATLMKPGGEVRFQEPAVNSRLLDTLRWTMPVPGRPSSLNRRAFREWKQHDPHPQRDNSSSHFEEVGRRYFNQVQVITFGGLERLRRLILDPELGAAYAEWAFGVERRYLPGAIRRTIARCQTIIYSDPIEPIRFEEVLTAHPIASMTKPR